MIKTLTRDTSRAPILALLAITCVGIISHLAPHLWGFSTVGAVGMVAAAYLPRVWWCIPVVVTVAAADLVNGTYAWLAMAAVYLAHLLAAWSARPVLKQVSTPGVCLAGIFSAVVFYLVSNLAPILMQHYPNTVEGWVACYVNALPFLARGIAANLLFAGSAFICIELTRRMYANRFSTA